MKIHVINRLLVVLTPLMPRAAGEVRLKHVSQYCVVLILHFCKLERNIFNSRRYRKELLRCFFQCSSLEFPVPLGLAAEYIWLMWATADAKYAHTFFCMHYTTKIQSFLYYHFTCLSLQHSWVVDLTEKRSGFHVCLENRICNWHFQILHVLHFTTCFSYSWYFAFWIDIPYVLKTPMHHDGIAFVIPCCNRANSVVPAIIHPGCTNRIVNKSSGRLRLMIHGF